MNIDNIIRYEQGELSDEETIALFQELVDSGAIYHLQGQYQRMAANLIEGGLVHADR